MILKYIYIYTFIVGILLIVLISISNNIYDVQQAKKKKLIKTYANKRKFKKRPYLSILISTKNNEDSIEKCLQSVINNKYRKIDIIIIDNNSKDNTKSMIKSIKLKYPKKYIRLIARRSDKQDNSLYNACKKYAIGELILLLDPNSGLTDNALLNSVNHFNLDSSIDMLNFKPTVKLNYKINNLFHLYYILLQNRYNKFLSVTKFIYYPNNLSAMFKKEIFVAIKKTNSTNTQNIETGKKIYFADDVTYFNIGAIRFRKFINDQFRSNHYRLISFASKFKYLSNYEKLIRFMRLIINLSIILIFIFIPFLITYFIVIAIGLHQTILLKLCIMLLSIIIFFAIWNDSQLKFSRKLILSLLIPITFLVFYIMSFIKLITMTSGLRKPNCWLNKASNKLFISATNPTAK